MRGWSHSRNQIDRRADTVLHGMPRRLSARHEVLDGPRRSRTTPKRRILHTHRRGMGRGPVVVQPRRGDLVYLPMADSANHRRSRGGAGLEPSKPLDARHAVRRNNFQGRLSWGDAAAALHHQRHCPTPHPHARRALPPTGARTCGSMRMGVASGTIGSTGAQTSSVERAALPNYPDT
jgi:hypothetical protein